ncbi:phasin [Notoacmeibacter sp. MSK16QG-6]|uniref:phasin n=1 Tax=Notoacmeibacter sp. MSK16QG-6 TaxID=2957982 RepID=UPI0020A173B1|nr:phasin [Notoacmeibacter sp. MSK16QG-6]MCP1198540.1 phasin [Notoacmeibacter sp. MSK16QG-6]
MARSTTKTGSTNTNAADEAPEAAKKTVEAATTQMNDAATAAMASFNPEAVSEQFRSFAEKGMAQTQEAYAKMKSQAEENQKAMEESVETVRSAVQTVSKKSIENARQQSQAAFDHVERLMGVNSISEFLEIQTAFLRQQAEMNIAQAKEMQSVTSGAVEEVSKPARQAFSKAVDGMTS